MADLLKVLLDWLETGERFSGSSPAAGSIERGNQDQGFSCDERCSRGRLNQA